MDENQYGRLYNTVENIRKEQGEIKEIVIKNTASLDEHIRRTTVAEKRLELIEADLEPVKDHVKAVGLIVKLAAGALGVVGTIAGIVEVIRNLQSM